MISKPTVFILGAGASLPYGFPSGAQLLHEICNDPLTPEFCDYHKIDPDQYTTFRRELLASRRSSVDAFLEYRREFEDVGKKAIAHCLIRAENDAKLDACKPEEDWYVKILDRMSEDTSFEDFGRNKVGFVTFNYDRSLEHFLRKTVVARYNKPAAEVEAVLNKIEIIHVHGQLGYLGWQSGATGGNGRWYEPICKAKDLETAAKGIKIISENIDDSPEFRTAHQLMSSAERIGILGFGYHQTNMRRLRLPLGRVPVIGTSRGFTGTEMQEIQLKHTGLALGFNSNLELLRNSPEFQE
jgi:hypothetical protein